MTTLVLIRARRLLPVPMRRLHVILAACLYAACQYAACAPSPATAGARTSSARTSSARTSSARTSAAAAATTGFLSAPTDQLGVPGTIAGGEITPEGNLYTGWAEYELRFGRRLTAWDQPTRTLPDPTLPLLSSVLSDGPVRYTRTVFAVTVAGRPVAYDTVTATNNSARSREAQVTMALAYTRGRQIRGAHGLPTGAFRYERPVVAQRDGYYEQPGQPFSTAFAYSTSGRDLDRSGLLLARGPAAASQPLGIPAANTPSATHDGRRFRALLKAHGRVSFTWQMPLEALAGDDRSDQILDSVPASKALAELHRAWSAEEAGMMKISVPEPKVTATYEAAITEMLCSRYRSPSGWVQTSNKLQYQAYWIRDGAIESDALDLAGLHAQAEQNLAFQDTFQQPDGLFISRAAQYDGFGQALWAFDQHAQLTQDPAYASAQLGRIQAAIGWLSWVTATDPLGLLPPGNPGDDELAYGHVTGDNLWAAAGLRSAIAIAILAGRRDLVAAWQAVDDRFETSLDGAVTVAVARAGHLPPILDAPDGQDWGNYYAAYPVQVLPVSSPAVSSTMAWARAHMVQGLPTYNDGHSLHDYLGFSTFQTDLASGSTAAAIAGLYAELTHTTATDNGWEWGISPFGSRASPVDLAPHGTFAGDYVALLRNMLVADGVGGVNLLAGASPAWLAPGQHITVTRAPTDRGVISFTEHSTARGETLNWQSSLTPGADLTWTLPSWAHHIRIAGKPVDGSVIALAAPAGSVTVVFDGRRPRQSYAEAAAALNASYEAHSQPAPLAHSAG
jgi:hypothetical protein